MAFFASIVRSASLAPSPDTFSPIFFSNLHCSYLNETCYTCSLRLKLYDVLVFDPIFEKKSRSPHELSIFFVVSPLKNFVSFTGIQMKLSIPAPYRHGFMTFWFLTPFLKQKNLAPPMNLAFFRGFPRIFFIVHWYPNETWYTYSLSTWLYDVLVFDPIFEKKISPPHELNIFLWFPHQNIFNPSLVSQ